MNKINIAIAGLGTVGSEVAKQLQINNEFLSKKAGRKLNLIAVSAKDKSKNRGFDQSKLNLNDIAYCNWVKSNSLFCLCESKGFIMSAFCHLSFKA